MIDITEIEDKLGINYAAAIIQPVSHSLLDKSGVRLYMKCEDLIHPIISGNKWRKLKYNLIQALESGHNHLISMGGAYSNHLHALAYIGYKLGIKTTGIIRGEQPEQESQTLLDLRQWGMHLKFVDRETFRQYRQYREPDAKPAKDYGGFWITEGAANQYSLPGVAEILNDINIDYDVLALSCGTGTTLAGLINTLPANKTLLGIAALKGKDFLEKDINKLLKTRRNNWSLNLDYHFGGFAKQNDELRSFIKDFQEQTNIPLEPIYNGKMLFGIFDLIKKDYFRKEQKIIAIHTGGLQGNRN